MSRQRVCDLDGTLIDGKKDRFFTVTDSATGVVKDICLQCSRSNAGVTTWTAGATYQLGARVRKVGGSMGKWIGECVLAGQAGATEPVWPSTVGAFTNDGSLRWVTVLAPNDNTRITVKVVGLPNLQLSVYGFITDSGEPA